MKCNCAKIRRNQMLMAKYKPKFLYSGIWHDLRITDCINTIDEGVWPKGRDQYLYDELKELLNDQARINSSIVN